MSDVPLRLTFAMMQQDRIESVRRNVERVLPYVDNAVIVDNGSTDGTREWLASLAPKVTAIHRQWDDSFVGARNAYLDAIGANADIPTFVCVADDDELYSEDLLKELRTIVEGAYLDDCNMIRIRSKSVETDWKGDLHWERMDEWHKPLVFLWESGMKYVGIGKSLVHEDLVVPSGRRERLLNDEEGKYYYSHVKKHGEIWARGIRNAFAGGGGPNLGDLCPFWKPFRAMAKDLLGIETADKFYAFLRDGKDLPKGIADFFVSKRLIGTKFDPTPPLWPKWPDGTSEWREGFLAWFLYFHPDQMPYEFVDSDKGYMNYRNEARIIHGPAAPEWASSTS